MMMMAFVDGYYHLINVALVFLFARKVLCRPTKQHLLTFLLLFTTHEDDL